jgi:hypothetical protein
VKKAAAVLACIALFAGCSHKDEVHSETSSSSASSMPVPPSGPLSFADPLTTNGCPGAACFAIVKRVADGAKINTLPDDLAPALKDIKGDLRRPNGGQCSTLPMAGLKDAQQPCIFAHGKPGAPLLVLVGDSQAWSTTIDKIAADLGYRFALIYHAGCKLPDLTFPDTLGYTDAQCKEWLKDTVAWINQQNPAAVIAASTHSVRYNHADYAAGYAARLKQLQAPGRKLFVMGDVPTMYQDPGPCLSAHADNVLKCATLVGDAVKVDDHQSAIDAAKQGGASYVNVVPFLCTDKLCPAIIGPNYAGYQDQYHLTSTYAQQLVPVVKQALGLQPAS